jgi:hypothetical protein
MEPSRLRQVSERAVALTTATSRRPIGAGGERSLEAISIVPPLAVIDALFAQEAEWKMSNPLAH